MYCLFFFNFFLNEIINTNPIQIFKNIYDNIKNSFDNVVYTNNLNEDTINDFYLKYKNEVSVNKEKYLKEFQKIYTTIFVNELMENILNTSYRV